MALKLHTSQAHRIGEDIAGDIVDLHDTDARTYMYPIHDLSIQRAHAYVDRYLTRMREALHSHDGGPMAEAANRSLGHICTLEQCRTWMRDLVLQLRTTGNIDDREIADFIRQCEALYAVASQYPYPANTFQGMVARAWDALWLRVKNNEKMCEPAVGYIHE